jgi:hypothetical protein
VNRQRDTRSFGLREDMVVSLELNFGNSDKKRAQARVPVLQKETPRGRRGVVLNRNIVSQQ